MKKSTVFMLFSAAAVMLCLGCSSVTEAQRADSGGIWEDRVLLYIEMETSSDWCDLQINEGFEIERGIITAYSEYSSVFMEESMIHIQQPKANAESDIAVSVEAYIAVIPDGDEIQFEIQKGALGTTEVRVYRLNSPVAELLGEFGCDGETPPVYPVSLALSRKSPKKDDLPYPAAELEGMLANWKEGISSFTFPAYSLYWPDARHITASPDGYYRSENAVDMLKEEMDNGPDPSLDYSLLGFSAPFHIPGSDKNEDRVLMISTYDGVPSGSDLFRFEKRDIVWKISSHFWSLGFNIP